jgi:GcrA cell cycle regulator
MANLRWGKADDARLTELWGTMPAKQIAEIIGNATKNAVIGRAHRLHLPVRKEPGTPRAKKRKHDPRVDYSLAKRFRRPRIVPAHVAKPKPPVEVPMPESLLLSIMELGNFTCKYPDDGERAVTFCGNPCASAAKPWCDFHLRVVYTAPQRRSGSHGFAIKRNFDLPEVVA